jgi:hypothetical protein
MEHEIIETVYLPLIEDTPFEQKIGNLTYMIEETDCKIRLLRYICFPCILCTIWCQHIHSDHA